MAASPSPILERQNPVKGRLSSGKELLLTPLLTNCRLSRSGSFLAGPRDCQ